MLAGRCDPYLLFCSVQGVVAKHTSYTWRSTAIVLGSPYQSLHSPATSEHRFQDPPTPLGNPIDLLHVPYPVQHQRSGSLQVLAIDLFLANLPENSVLLRHTQDQQDSHEVLRPSEQVRYQTLLVLGWRHGQRPKTSRLDGQGAAASVVGRHELGEVQGLVDEWAEHHESRVVEARAELCCHHVKIVPVTDWDGALIR